MTLICSRRDLHEAVQTVGRAAATQAALAILNHILLVSESEQLLLSATDSNLSSQTSIHAQGTLPESLTVPAKTFSELLSFLPDGPMELERGPRHTLIIRHGDICFELKGFHGEEFPKIPVVHTEGDDSLCVRIDQKTMRRMIRQTVFCAGQDQARIQYTGILFEREETIFRLVATDGVMRAAVASTLTSESSLPISAIVPAHTVVEFSRILKTESEEPAFLHFRNDPAGPTLASFEANGVTLVSRLIEGAFAPWRRYFDLQWQERATVKSADILSALRRVNILAQNENDPVHLFLSGEALRLSSQSPALGQAEESIPVLTEGSEVLIALNGRHLAEGIGVLEEEGCRIELASDLSPCVVRPLEGSHYTYMQSPMHLR